MPTNQNPADLASRFVPAHQLALTNWFIGPKFLLKDNQSHLQHTYYLVKPSLDTNIRPQVSTLKITIRMNLLGFPIGVPCFARWLFYCTLFMLSDKTQIKTCLARLSTIVEQESQWKSLRKPRTASFELCRKRHTLKRSSALVGNGRFLRAVSWKICTPS